MKALPLAVPLAVPLEFSMEFERGLRLDFHLAQQMVPSMERLSALQKDLPWEFRWEKQKVQPKEILSDQWMDWLKVPPLVQRWGSG